MVKTLDQFQWVVNTQDFVVIDTETTTFGRQAEIIQLAVVNGKGEVLINTMVKPLGAIDPKATEIHGITDAMLQHAPSFAEVAAQLTLERLGREVLTYNAAFDRAMVNQSIDRHNRPRLTWEMYSSWACVMQAYRQWRNSKVTVSLSKALTELGIPRDNAHDALADALAALQLARKIAGVNNA